MQFVMFRVMRVDRSPLVAAEARCVLCVSALMFAEFLAAEVAEFTQRLFVTSRSNTTHRVF